MTDLTPWSSPAGSTLVDVGDRVGRHLGIVDDIADDAARLLGHVTIDNPAIEIANDVGNPVPVNGTVTITDGSGPVTVDGTVAVGGNVEVTNDVGNPLPVSDGGGSLTVDPNAGATWDISDRAARQNGIVLPPAMWALSHAPGANTKATVTKAAVVGKRHYCVGIIATTVTTGAAASNDVWLNDGATGGAALLAAFSMAATSALPDRVALAGLNIEGSVNTAMTLEFNVAGGATIYQRVTLIGYTL